MIGAYRQEASFSAVVRPSEGKVGSISFKNDFEFISDSFIAPTEEEIMTILNENYKQRFTEAGFDNVNFINIENSVFEKSAENTPVLLVTVETSVVKGGESHVYREYVGIPFAVQN